MKTAAISRSQSISGKRGGRGRSAAVSVSSQRPVNQFQRTALGHGCGEKCWSKTTLWEANSSKVGVTNQSFP